MNFELLSKGHLENIFPNMAKFTKRELLKILLLNNDLSEATDYILLKLNIKSENCLPQKLQDFKASLSALRTRRNQKFEKASRKKDRFEKNNEMWLNSEFIVPDIITAGSNEKISSSLTGPGRHCLSFEEKSDRSKRREIANISASLDNDPNRILLACRKAAKVSKNKNLCTIIDNVLKNPEQ